MTKNENNKEKNINVEQNYSKIYSGETNKNSNPSLNNNQKRLRKDGKGIPIIKKKLLFKKTKHHAYLRDDLFANETIANIIDIPSYKKYNREGDVIEEEEDNEEQIENNINNNNNANVEINKDMHQCQCCSIF
jgi:hypothetical protein